MIEIAILAGIALSFGLVFVLFSCVCLPFPRKRPGFSVFDNSSYDIEAGNGYSLYASQDGSGDNSQVTFEPLPDILAKTVAATALKPRITCIDSEKQTLAAKHVSMFKPFPRSQLMYVKELGIGWFGQVLEGDADKITINSNRSRVVIKLLKDDATPYEQHLFLEEAAPYRELDHPNVLKLLGLCTETVPFLTILEQSAYGDLKTYLMRSKREAEALVRRGMLIKCLLDMAAGLACLHRHGYVHHDFACRNCLLMADMSVKVGDYGISEDKFREEYYDTGQDLLPVRWMAPESLTQNGNIWQVTQFTKEANIWSFGVAMWEVTELEKLPYFSMSDEDVLQKVVADRIIKLPISHSKGLQKQKLNDVMQFCWLDVTNRPTIEEVHRLIHQIQQDTTKQEDFDSKWNKLPSKDTKIVKVEVHSSAQNKITKIDYDQMNPDLKIKENKDSKHEITTSSNSGGFVPDSKVCDTSKPTFQKVANDNVFDDGSSVVIGDKGHKHLMTDNKSGFHSPNVGLVNSEPVTPISSNRNSNTYQLTSTPVSREHNISNNTDSTTKYVAANSESEPFKQNTENIVTESVTETPKRNVTGGCEEIHQDKTPPSSMFDQNEHPKVKRTLLVDSVSSGQTSPKSDIPKIEVNNKPVHDLGSTNSASVDLNRCKSVDSKNGTPYHTNDIEAVLEGGDIVIHEIEDEEENYKNGDHDEVEIEQLKLSIADALNVNNQNFDFERRSSDPDSPDDYETLVAKEIYMSKGTTIPPTKHTTPRSLTTIPEDSIATGDMSGSSLRFIEPLEDSVFSVPAQDSFEWDDYIGEQLVGHVKNLENSPRQSMEFQDWTLDQDSSQESDSQNNSKMDESNKRHNSSSSSIGTSDSEVKHVGLAARSIISEVIAKSNRYSNHATNKSHPIPKHSFYALSHSFDEDSPEHVPYDLEPSGSPESISSGSNQFVDEWELM